MNIDWRTTGPNRHPIPVSLPRPRARARRRRATTRPVRRVAARHKPRRLPIGRADFPPRQARDVWGAALTILALYLIAGLAAVSFDSIAADKAGALDPVRRYLAYTLLPFVYLLGRGVYPLPVLLLFLAHDQLSPFHHARRRRWSIRWIASIPLVCAFFSGLALLSGAGASAGGAVGRTYFMFVDRAVDGTMASAVGLAVSFGCTCFVWSRNRRWMIDKVAAGGSAAARTVRVLARWIHQRRKRRGRVSVGEPFLQERSTAPVIRPGPSESRWTLGEDLSRGALPFGAQWMIDTSNGATEKPGEENDEWAFTPLPGPDRDCALPLDILPRTDSAAPAERLSRAQLDELQAKIIHVVARDAGVELEPSEVPCGVGLGSIQLFFEKTGGRRLRQIEQVLEDVEHEVKRSPISLHLGAQIRMDVALSEEERVFAPIRPLLEATARGEDDRLTYLVGRTQAGAPFELDVEGARHVLVAGETGGGKTVLLHNFIFGFIFRYPPSRVRLALADLKGGLGFDCYRGLPHLWHQVVTTETGLSNLLRNLTEELRRRKRLVRDGRVEVLPALVTIIDEFADVDSASLARLIAQARALRMYFVLATQFPRGDVVATTIKANLVTRIALRTSSHHASMLIIDRTGAENLRSKGDALVSSEGEEIHVQVGLVTTNDSANGLSDTDAVAAYLTCGPPNPPTVCAGIRSANPPNPTGATDEGRDRLAVEP